MTDTKKFSKHFFFINCVTITIKDIYRFIEQYYLFLILIIRLITTLHRLPSSVSE